MDAAQFVIFAILLVAPALIAFNLSDRWRGFLYSMLLFWVVFVFAAQYEMAYYPNRISTTPIYTIFWGWLPASIYALFLLFLVAAFGRVSTSDIQFYDTNSNGEDSEVLQIHSDEVIDEDAIYCTGCNETIESGFEACWKCGTPY